MLDHYRPNEFFRALPVILAVAGDREGKSREIIQRDWAMRKIRRELGADGQNLWMGNPLF